jgi:ribosome-associated toxin RatA of RatAB toxin-antitoxin module
MLNLSKPFRCTLSYCCFVVLSIWGLAPCSVLGADFCRLAAGEIVTYAVDVPGSGAKRGEATGVVDAPPEKVWQVVTDANNFPEFLPRIIKSRLVRFEELKRILQERPSSAFEAEAMFSSSPPDLSLFRIPGQKYTGYFYGHFQLPWPIRDRWYIVRVKWDETQANRQIYTCSWSLLVGNMREYSGEWKVEPFNGNRTQLTYQSVIDPGGFVPKSLIKEFTSKTLPEVIAGVRKRVVTAQAR